MIQVKYCCRCKKEYPTEYFSKDRGQKDGFHTWCKRCNKEWKLIDRYGIDLRDYDNLFVNQDGKCAICRLPQAEQIKPLEVDHDHKTNSIRGLLCQNCNKVLGLIYDDIRILNNMIDYLDKARIYNGRQ